MKLLVVGKGDSKRFMAMAGDLGISEQVIFAGVTDEVEKYYLMPERKPLFLPLKSDMKPIHNLNIIQFR